MSDPMSDPVIATLAASPPRRFVGVAMLAMLGGLLVYLALALPFSGTQVFLILGGLASLWAGARMHSATSQLLELSQEELRVKDGPILAKIADIEKVERGPFAFKPSNGFLITLKSQGTRRWAPGLFWSFSRKIGVGGVTGAPQTKGLAEAMSALVAERQIAAS